MATQELALFTVATESMVVQTGRMQRDLDALGTGIFDVLVVGGGASGAACAREAALRGLSTALIERDDFGGGASAHCFKVVHGGIRYLQHADLARMRAYCRERAAFLHIAPHLVAPMAFAVPTFGSGRAGKWLLGAGMLAYDALTLGINGAVADPSRRIARTRFLGRAETLERFDVVDATRLTGAAVFEDAQMYNPPRLVLALVQTAADHGACVANYVGATRLMVDGDRVIGVAARDSLTGADLTIRARMVINAAGPWAESVLRGAAATRSTSLGAFSRDACFLVGRPLGRSDMAVAVPGRSRDADALLARATRHMFLVPWRGATLVGVWHGVVPTDPDTTDFSRRQLRDYLHEINACCPGLDLAEADVRIAGFGLVPFGASDSQGGNSLSFGKESRFIDHRATHGLSGLVTCVSVRYTAARMDGAAALDLAGRQLPMPASPVASLRERVPGGDIDDFPAFLRNFTRSRPDWLPGSAVEPLVRNFGTRATSILRLAGVRPELAACIPGTATTLAEVVHVVETELALRLTDVLFRRTDMATTGHPGEAAIDCVERLMADMLQWSPERRTAERDAVRAHLARYLATGPGLSPA